MSNTITVPVVDFIKAHADKNSLLSAASLYIAALDWAASDGGAWGIDRAEAKRNVEEALAELRRVIRQIELPPSPYSTED